MHIDGKFADAFCAKVFRYTEQQRVKDINIELLANQQLLSRRIGIFNGIIHVDVEPKHGNRQRSTMPLLISLLTFLALTIRIVVFKEEKFARNLHYRERCNSRKKRVSGSPHGMK